VAESAADRQILAAYRRTRWDVEVDGPRGPVPVSLAARVSPAALPLPGGIVTAYNPGSTLRSRADNEREQEMLLGALFSRRFAWFPTLAHGTGECAEAWDEPGFYVAGAERSELVDLAAQHGQNAILWIESDGVPYLYCARAGFAGAARGARL
jgi:hypothetical protein